MSVTVKVEMKPVRQLLKDHGLDREGHVQKYWTGIVNKRIEGYMPYRTGMLATKLKFMAGPGEIKVAGPYARYQYYGKVMVNAATGKGPAFIPGIGFRYRKFTKLRVTDRPLEYDRTKRPEAGPFWDRLLIAAEGDVMLAEMREYINRTGGSA